jgi:GNAT superfamily N-acetyltransferase
MEVRDYKPKDKKEIIEMVSSILGRMFSGDPEDFQIVKEFNSNKDYVKYLVLIIEGKVVATGALKRINKDEVRLKRLYVGREYQRRGLAQKILNELISFAKTKKYKRMFFSSYPVMENARKFNKINGFKETTGKDPEQIHLVKQL